MSQRLSVSVAAFPLQMHWHYAGDDLSPPNHIHQCSDRVSMRSKYPPKCLRHSADIPCGRQDGRIALTLRPTSRLGADINSP